MELRFKTLEQRGRSEIRRSIELLTPTFGGGVYVEQNELRRQLKPSDPITPLRSAAIRGQLRFWWRATYGCLYPSIAAMRKREAEIWGATAVPGAVSLRLGVSGIRLTSERAVFEPYQSAPGKPWNPRAIKGFPRGIVYGAFPLQPKGKQEAPIQGGTLHEFQGQSELILSCPLADVAEVTDALDCWLTFGGIGGRTRRGFGAIRTSVPIDPSALLNRIRSRREEQPLLLGVPTLHAARLVVTNFSFKTGMEALNAGLEALQRFRQGPRLGRNPPADPASKKPAGRSRWPEPETIRILTGCIPSRHASRLVGVDKFPRAAFGLPIIFHFNAEPGEREPPDARLVPKNAERMASPLIIRPFVGANGVGCMALALDSGTCNALNLVLKVDHPDGKTGSARRPKEFAVEHTLTASEGARIQPLSGQTDPLAAFLKVFVTLAEQTS